MSLSEDLRDELAGIAPTRRCCRIAELSALFHAAGSWHLRAHGERTVHLDLSSPAAARRAFALLRDLGLASELRTYRRRTLDRAARYQLHVPVDGAVTTVLREAGVLSATGAPLVRPARRVVGRSCCRGAYLRGALLGGGSLSGPRDLHLELRQATADGAAFLVWLCGAEELSLHVVERRDHHAVYAKAAEVVADVLAVAGASQTAIRLDEHGVLAAMRAEANRLANGDAANVKRTVSAASEQLEAIRRLDVELLPTKLREIATLRLRHPSLALGELAERCHPPITKAAAHHRMTVLRRLAEDRAGAEPGPEFHDR